MKKNIELLLTLKTQIEILEYEDGNLDAALKRAKMLINKIFGEKSEYLNDLKKISWSPFIFTNNTPDSEFENSFYSGKNKMLNLINVMNEDLALDEIGGESNDVIKPTIGSSGFNDSIFIVHGHNEEMKHSVARAVEQLGLKPVILHEQASQGKTIIEKFTHYSDVGFAIVLLSADDIAYPKSDVGKNPSFRARQNVILELGYFLGKLGRDKVLALHEDNVRLEIPSDYQGVLFIPFDKNEGWKYAVVKELKASGYNIDSNKIL